MNTPFSNINKTNTEGSAPPKSALTIGTNETPTGSNPGNNSIDELEDEEFFSDASTVKSIVPSNYFDSDKNDEMDFLGEDTPIFPSQGSATTTTSLNQQVDLMEIDSRSKPQTGKMKVSGSFRRRVKFLKDIVGQSDEQARLEAASSTMDQLKSTYKRREMSNDTTPEQPIPKKGRHETAPTQAQAATAKPVKSSLRYNESVSLVKVAITTAGFPQKRLSSAQMDLVERELMEAVLEQADKEIKPYFFGCSHKPGFMVLNCGDEHTAKWVRDSVPHLKPWEESQLVTLEKDQIPKPHVLIGHFPKSVQEPNDKILRRIVAQNTGLMAYSWLVLQRTDQNDMAIVTLSVDPLSHERLKETQFRINWLFGSVRLQRPKPKSGSSSERVDLPSTSVSTDRVTKPSETNTVPKPETNTAPKPFTPIVGRRRAIVGNPGPNKKHDLAERLKFTRTNPGSQGGKPDNTAPLQKDN